MSGRGKKEKAIAAGFELPALPQRPSALETAAVRAATETEVGEPEPTYAVTTVRLTQAQHLWVRQEALRLAKPGKKPDASAVIRALIDAARSG